MTSPGSADETDPLDVARAVLASGARALERAATRVDDRFAVAVDAIVGCSGRLVVTGMGKAGFIARKLSATFASTGTPSLFLHPAEALHGDLGRITGDDLVLALSNSGETEEIVRLLGPLARVGAGVIAITGDSASTLGAASIVTLAIGAQEEAGHGLAPTTSTTVMLGVGDALAMACQAVRGFTEEEFARFHPGGTLGKRFVRVSEVMRVGDQLPVIAESAGLSDALGVMTQTPGRPGAALVVDDHGALVGLFTDGDLRRVVQAGGFDATASLRATMNRGPRTVRPDDLVMDAARLLRTHGFDQVPVVDEAHRPVGLLDVQDLLSLRLL